MTDADVDIVFFGRQRSVHPHADEAHGAGVLGSVLTRRQVPGVGQLRQVRPHLVDPDGPPAAQLQGHRRHLRSLLELARRQGSLSLRFLEDGRR